MPTSKETRGSKKKKKQASLKYEYFVCPNQCLDSLLNQVVAEHPKSCPKPNFSIKKVFHKLISVTIEASCLNCKYTALHNAPFGQKPANDFLKEIGIVPGTKHGLGDLAKKVGPVIREVAKESMDKHAEQLKSFKSKGREVGYGVDGRYNNSMSRRLGVGNEAATQVTVPVTGMTADRSYQKVIGLKMLSKVCIVCTKKEIDHYLKTSEILRIKDWICSDCTRDIGPEETISREGELLREVVEEHQKKHDLEPDFIVADGDAKISKVTKELGYERQFDSRHLNKAISRRTPTPSATNLKNMQGKNKDQRTAQWKLMKESVSKRCQAEIARAAEKTKKIFGKARLNRVQTLLQDTPAAVLACHTGNCGDLCKSSSLVCSGKKNGKQYNDHIGPKLKKNKNKKQIEILKNMIHVRLVEKLPDTYKNVGTNFIEGVNRAIISTNPKTKN